MLFLGDLTDEEIAKRASCSRSTITRLKRDPNFIQAQQEYAIYQLDHSLPQSVSQLLNLINNSKSDMVKLQAIQTVLKHSDKNKLKIKFSHWWNSSKKKEAPVSNLLVLLVCCQIDFKRG